MRLPRSRRSSQLGSGVFARTTGARRSYGSSLGCPCRRAPTARPLDLSLAPPICCHHRAAIAAMARRPPPAQQRNLTASMTPRSVSAAVARLGPERFRVAVEIRSRRCLRWWDPGGQTPTCPGRLKPGRVGPACSIPIYPPPSAVCSSLGVPCGCRCRAKPGLAARLRPSSQQPWDQLKLMVLGSPQPTAPVGLPGVRWMRPAHLAARHNIVFRQRQSPYVDLALER